MAIWKDIPTEIVLYILRHLLLYDTHSISLVSHQLRSYAEPLLYRSVELNASDVGPNNCHGEDPHVYVRRFTRTIVNRPKLGAHVRDLKLMRVWDVVEDYDAMEDCTNCSTSIDVSGEGEEHEALVEATAELARVGVDDYALANVQQDLRTIVRATEAKGLPNGLLFKGGYRGMAIVLLHHLPSLKKLEMTGLRDLETIALSCFGLVEGSVPVGLLSLKELTMIYDDQEVSLSRAYFQNSTNRSCRNHGPQRRSCLSCPYPRFNLTRSAGSAELTTSRGLLVAMTVALFSWAQ